MGRALVLAWMVVVAGCVEDRTVLCGDKRWPAGCTCLPDDTCVSPEQLSRCVGATQGEACTAASVMVGQCLDGVCRPIVCGDGQTWGPEVCDDNNQIAGDGCAADCRSDETCPNGIIDPITGEQCDDSNALAGDGCATTRQDDIVQCRLEIPGWRDISPTFPAARYDLAAAYDDQRARVVMYGGHNGVQTLDDTWELDGTLWRMQTTSAPPQRRSTHALAYDVARGETVMFGGTGLTGTFTWDGLVWTKKTPTDSPLPRTGVAMAYDRVRERVVLYGGSPMTGTPDTKTWLWDGAEWTSVSTTTQLPEKVSLAWDPISQQVVAIGVVDTRTMYAWTGSTWNASPMSFGYAHQKIAGIATGVMLLGMTNDEAPRMHLWNGSTWSPATIVAPMMKAFSDFAMVYAAKQNTTYVIMGRTNVARTDVWRFASGGWSMLFPTTNVQSYPGGAGAYEPATGRIVKFGGRDGATSPVTSEWDGWHWIDMQMIGDPSGRTEQSMVALDDRVLMFGGSDNNGAHLAELWERRDGKWTQLPDAPGPRVGASMFHDRARNRVIVFGGFDATNTSTNTTWAWDGTTWTTLAPQHAPPPRAFATAAYHRVHDQAVLFGGEVSAFTSLLDDTWIWDGNDWIEQSVVDGPSARARVDAAYHPLRKSIVMFGGAPAPIDETWEWTGTAWQRIDVATSALARRNHVTAYDAVRRQLVLHGGLIGAQGLADTVALEYRSASTPAELCDGNDADRDELIGCEDPDCWGRCTPMCPPGASCDPAAPHCGDGVCSVIENRRVCPIDCS